MCGKVKMNKEQFLFLLGIRAELQKEADAWIAFGIGINSKRTAALWKICDQIVKQCEKELKLPVSEYHDNSHGRWDTLTREKHSIGPKTASNTPAKTSRTCGI